MATRNGKIANLPNDIREKLNLHLLEGDTAREVAAWLNALPEVQSILNSQFNGSPISEVNLTHWRQGGYLQWLTERECFDSARALAAGDRNLASTGLSAERLLNVLTVRFGQLLMRWDFAPDECGSSDAAFAQMAKKARIVQGISRSLLAIHRIQSESATKNLGTATSSEPSSRGAGVGAGGGPGKGGGKERGEPIRRGAGVGVGGGPGKDGGPGKGGGKETGELASPRTSLNQTVKPSAANPRDFVEAGKQSQSEIPKILSAMINPAGVPSNPASTSSFKDDLDLSEILEAV